MSSSNRGTARTLFLVATFFTKATLAVYDTLYHWQYPKKVDGYNRVIQLSHAGDSNGKLLATFEHSNNSNPSSFIIRQSNDSGASWDSLATTNHGKSWNSTGKWQPAYANVTDPATGKWTRAGIWEPFVFMDSKDRLVAVFSGERNYTHHSQMIVHVTSEDGGVSWGNFTLDVADDNQASRPGMASVAKMDNGQYFMSYEWCDINTYPGHPCAANGKLSTDGVTWNPKDNGSAVTTPDHVQADGSPYSIWDPVEKQLIVSSRSKRQYNVVPSTTGPKGSSVPEDGKVVHINTNQGKVSQDAGWIQFNGTWSVSGDKFNFAPVTEPATLALTGSSGWTDYQISADAITTSKSAVRGLLLRASNFATAPNHFIRYTAAIDSNRGTLNLYQVAKKKTTTLRSIPISGGVEANQEYHLSFSAKSNSLIATLTGSGGKNTTLNATDYGLLHGAAGLYGAEGSGGFRNVHITAL